MIQRICNTLFAAVLILYPFAFLDAQNQQMNFRNLTRDDGLSHSVVFSICQDKRGFMWFGTSDGLNRFDGYKFTVYRNDPKDSTSISANNIAGLFEDRKGRFWIGTLSDGLNLYDRDNDCLIHYSTDAKSEIVLDNNFVRDMGGNSGWYALDCNKSWNYTF